VRTFHCVRAIYYARYNCRDVPTAVTCVLLVLRCKRILFLFAFNVFASYISPSVSGNGSRAFVVTPTSQPPTVVRGYHVTVTR